MSVSTMSLLVGWEERAFSFLRDNPGKVVECVAHGRIYAGHYVGCGFSLPFSGLARSREIRALKGRSYVDIADCNAWHDCSGVLNVREMVKSVSSGRSSML
jgi:hypothetical protein